MKKFYTPSEIAKLCEVSTGSVIRWIREGKLPAGVTGGGHYRVRKEELGKFLKALQIPLPAGLSALPEKKVLIVDDEDNVRGLIRVLLKQEFPEILIEEAGEGFVAGWKAHNLRPDLVILDINLPGLDGFGVCELVRSFPEHSRTKILVVTGRGEDDRERMLKLGADDFLKKPFDNDQFIEKVRENLELPKTGGREDDATPK